MDPPRGSGLEILCQHIPFFSGLHRWMMSLLGPAWGNGGFGECRMEVSYCITDCGHRSSATSTSGAGRYRAAGSRRVCLRHGRWIYCAPGGSLLFLLSRLRAYVIRLPFCSDLRPCLPVQLPRDFAVLRSNLFRISLRLHVFDAVAETHAGRISFGWLLACCLGLGLVCGFWCFFGVGSC